jgi:hypothetical protein
MNDRHASKMVCFNVRMEMHINSFLHFSIIRFVVQMDFSLDNIPTHLNYTHAFLHYWQQQSSKLKVLFVYPFRKPFLQDRLSHHILPYHFLKYLICEY